MGKQKGTPTFGTTVEEVDGSIAQMNAEREAIAAKQGTKDFDNKRFEELSNNLEQANIQRAQLSPPDKGVPQTFTEQRTTVPPAQVGGEAQTTTTFGAPAQSNQGIQGMNPLDMTGQSMPGGQEVIGAQSQLGNDLSLLNNQQSFSSPDIPQEQIQQGGGSFMQNFLASIDRSKGDGIESSINKSMFGQPTGSGGGFKAQPLVDINANDLFFASNEPILKGTASGSFMGNQPIFVGGGDYFPAQVLNQRKKAIQDAAIAQKQKEQDFLSQRAPLIKDKGFQKNLNDRFNNEHNALVDEALETYGQDGWYDAITDQSTDIGRRYVNFSDNMNFLAGSADQSTDLIATTRNNMNEGKLVYSPETMQMLDDYENMQGQFANGDVGSLVNLREEYGKLQGYIGLDTYLNEKSVDIKPTVTAWASEADTNDAYVTYEQKKTAYEDQLRTLANGWATGKVPSELGPLVRSGMITEEDIFNHLQSLYGYDAISESSRKVTNKPAGSGGITINFDPNSQNTTQKTETINGVTYETGQTWEFNTQGKPMEITGAYSLDENGNKVAVDGIANVNPNSVQAIKVAVKQPDGSVKYEWQAGVVGKETQTVYYDRLGRQTTDKSQAVKSGTIQVDKVYVLDDNTKKRMKATYPGMDQDIDNMYDGVKKDVEERQGTMNKYDAALQGL